MSSVWTITGDRTVDSIGCSQNFHSVLISEIPLSIQSRITKVSFQKINTMNGGKQEKFTNISKKNTNPREDKNFSIQLCNKWWDRILFYLGSPNQKETKRKTMILSLDSSQIATFLECPTLWHYQYETRLMPRQQVPNVPMDMGTYGHKLLELAYKQIAKGQSSDEALDCAFAFDIDHDTCHCSHSRDKHLLLDTACTYCHCQKFESQPFPLEQPERDTVKNRVSEYFFLEGTTFPSVLPKSPNHVEVGFSHLLFKDDTHTFILEGRIDILGQIAKNCENGWMDHKFQLRQRDLYKKAIQFRNYAMVADLTIGMINYIRLTKKIEKDITFKRDIISFSHQELREWRDNLIHIFHRVACAIEASDWHNKFDKFRNRSSCTGKFGYECQYTRLCDEFSNPELIKILEQSEYQEKPKWLPW